MADFSEDFEINLRFDAWENFMELFETDPNVSIFNAADLLTELTGVNVEGFPSAEMLRPNDTNNRHGFSEKRISELVEGWREVDLEALLRGTDKPKEQCWLVVKREGQSGSFHVYEFPKELAELMRRRGDLPGIQ